MKYPFTPGPWEVDSGMVQTAYEHKCKTPNCGVHIPIAYMDRKPNNGTMPVERDSNAHLMAQAPELFQQLQFCVEQIRECMEQNHGRIWDNANTVVANAESVLVKLKTQFE